MSGAAGGARLRRYECGAVMKAWRPGGVWRSVRWSGWCGAAWAASGCGAAARSAEPIALRGRGRIVVANLTADEWQNVEVWLNDHYRVTKSRMPPGERFSIPFSAFVAGFGQRFDAARQPIAGSR